MGTIDRWSVYIVRWFVREIMFAYVLLCISSTVVRDTMGPYRFWPGRSGWSDGGSFVANSCYKLGRYCEICTASFWNGCESGKLWRAFAACEQGILFVICQGGVQVSRTFQLHSRFDTQAIGGDWRLRKDFAQQCAESSKESADVGPPKRCGVLL